MSKTILFFGTEDFSATSLQSLIDNSFDICTVVTKPDSAKGRSRELTPSPVKVIAEKNNIPVWQPENVGEITENIKKLGDVAGILVSYGKLIPDDVLELFKPGIINLHPSLLPKYRGPSPIESAILKGDSETGVSIMKLSAEMDAGPVYSQLKIPLAGTEYANELYKNLAQKGTEQLISVLPSILDGTLQPTEQNNDSATYCKLIEKTDGGINWQQSAPEIAKKIRAYNIWPKSRTKLGDVEVIIAKARVINGIGESGKVEISDNKLMVYCAESCLEIQQVQPIGKKEMPIQAFLAGYKSKIIVQ
ncbi:MAG: methionyl-tRNA formyltransferase [Candidatus Saccharibacteria bacterium]|nr:methionyl-tRNA formyltransferase [Candidatus Saccharibacteria bacterium]